MPRTCWIWRVTAGLENSGTITLYNKKTDADVLKVIVKMIDECWLKLETVLHSCVKNYAEFVFGTSYNYVKPLLIYVRILRDYLSALHRVRVGWINIILSWLSLNYSIIQNIWVCKFLFSSHVMPLSTAMISLVLIKCSNGKIVCWEGYLNVSILK